MESKAGLQSTNLVFEFIRRARRSPGDVYENCVWLDQMEVEGNYLKLIQAIDPHSVHIPEEIDAIRALVGKIPKERSQEATDSSLRTLKLGIYPLVVS